MLARGEDLGDRPAPAVGGQWILVLSPPREQPSTSRPGPVSPGSPLRPAGSCHSVPPPVTGSAGRHAGPGRVLVRAYHGGIGAEDPVLPSASPDPACSRGRISSPATSRPATRGDAGFRWSSTPYSPRQVTPRAAGPGPEEDASDHHPVITPSGPPPRIIGSCRCHSSSIRSCRLRRSSTRHDLYQARPKTLGHTLTPIANCLAGRLPHAILEW